MALTFEIAIIAGEHILPCKLIWRRYRRPAPGITEIFMDINPHLREHFISSPYLPVGVSVVIPIDSDIIAGRPQRIETQKMWGIESASAT